ncbi:MAG: RluA family pseudouridine synthase [Clostridia bacterium]|nr:RluA family pseudouridine synthase [Clostridia bacterium]
MKTATVNKNDASQRIDKFLGKYFKTMPKSLIYKGIRKKRIKVNGKRCDIDYILKIGDRIDLYINDEFFAVPDERLSFLKVTEPSLDIVYEDQNIILMDKRPGMIVHDDEDEKINTLLNHMKAYLYKKGEYDPDRENSFVPSLCNRIDRNTGGIVIGAKNAAALKIINDKIKTREIKKFYLCLVRGKLKQKEDTLTGYLVKNTEQNRVYIHSSPVPDGKSIRTKYKVIRENTLTSLVEVELLTGRTHQIRAHFASIGHPLAGDGKYGTNEFNDKVGMKAQALYSYKLKFDFSDENDLSYLNGKSFEVQSVPFANFEK